jgi:hypothetical protein
MKEGSYFAEKKSPLKTLLFYGLPVRFLPDSLFRHGHNRTCGNPQYYRKRQK